MTSAETVSNCVKFASSLKTSVGFAIAASEGQEIRKQIEAGQWEGISFPVPEEKQPRKRRSPYPAALKKEKVFMTNHLRKVGMGAKKSAKQAGVSYESYLRWMAELGITYEQP